MINMLKVLILILLYGLFFLMCYLGTGTLKKKYEKLLFLLKDKELLQIRFLEWWKKPRSVR